MCVLPQSVHVSYLNKSKRIPLGLNVSQNLVLIYFPKINYNKLIKSLWNFENNSFEKFVGSTNTLILKLFWPFWNFTKSNTIMEEDFGFFVFDAFHWFFVFNNFVSQDRRIKDQITNRTFQTFPQAIIPTILSKIYLLFLLEQQTLL